MKILFVRTFCPNPIAYGSEMRSSRLVDYLTTKGDVDLLTLTDPTDKADKNYIAAKFKNFYYFDQKAKNTRLTQAEKLLSFLPWQLDEYYSKEIQAKIHLIVERNQYDLIFVYKLNPVYYFLRLPSKWHTKIVIDFDDILSELYFNFYKDPITARKNSYSLHLYEQKALKHFKRVFLCSKSAVAKIKQWYQPKVGIVPNVFSAVPGDFFAPAADMNELLFVGSLDYFPNTEGLKWFFEHTWPELKRAYPALKLKVVGKAQKDGAALMGYFGGPKDVTVHVNVKSVRPYYEQCFASIVPLLNGSGTRLKILESVAFGRPVLTTVKGMEGLDFTDQKDIFVFHQDPKTFIDGYKALLNRDVYKSVTNDALRVLQEQYSPQAFTNYMDENWTIMKEGLPHASGERHYTHI